jgi:hypothetical protein
MAMTGWLEMIRELGQEEQKNMFKIKIVEDDL